MCVFVLKYDEWAYPYAFASALGSHGMGRSYYYYYYKGSSFPRPWYPLRHGACALQKRLETVGVWPETADGVTKDKSDTHASALQSKAASGCIIHGQVRQRLGAFCLLESLGWTPVGVPPSPPHSTQEVACLQLNQPPRVLWRRIADSPFPLCQ